jgi:hypothetical protein
MGGGGAMMMAVQAIRNNKKLLSKRKGRSLSLVTNSNKKTEYNLPKATPKKLEEIKIRLQKENKQRKVKRLVLLGISLTIIISVLIYFA